MKSRRVQQQSLRTSPSINLDYNSKSANTLNGGADSMNESRISFAEGLDYNAAVKFSGKATGLQPDDDTNDIPYYTSHRPVQEQQASQQPDPLTAQYETLRNLNNKSAGRNASDTASLQGRSYRVTDPSLQSPLNINIYKDQSIKINMTPVRMRQLPEISFNISQQQIEGLYDLLVEPIISDSFNQTLQQQLIDIKEEAEHYKMGLWMLQKLLSQKGMTLRDIQFRNHQGLLTKINLFLQCDNPELSLISLRTLLAYFQKFEGQDLPIKCIKEIGLIDKLHAILDHENELLGELTRLSLSVLTQISYNHPAEVCLHNIKKIISLCDGTCCQDLKTQEVAIKLICNLLTQDQSREDIIQKDGLFAIFHCLINNNKSALKYALACILNLTFLTNGKSNNIMEQITHNGGIAHLIGALQKASTLNDYQAMLYAIKALSNMAMSSPSVNLVIGEFGSLDILVSILQSQNQIIDAEQTQEVNTQSASSIMVHSVICMQSIIAINYNKQQLIDKSLFLLVSQQLISSFKIDVNLLKALLQTIANCAAESYNFARNITSAQEGELIKAIYSLMVRSSDEAVIRKCMRVYIALSNSGFQLSSVISQNEMQQFTEEKRPQFGTKCEKLLVKFTQAVLKPSMSKKQMASNDDALDWDAINKIRKATKGCLTILKERINSQFEKKREFDMSFGLGKVDEDEQSASVNKLQSYKEEMNKNTDLFIKKREETLMQIKRSEINIRKSKTPLRLNNNKATVLDSETQNKRLLNMSMVESDQQQQVSHFKQEAKIQENIEQQTIIRNKTPIPALRPNSKMSQTKTSRDMEPKHKLEPLNYIPQTLQSELQNTTIESFNSQQNNQSMTIQPSESYNNRHRILVKGGPLSVHSLNSNKHETDSRLNSRQSNNPFVYNPTQNTDQKQYSNMMDIHQYQRQTTIEPTIIEEQPKQPTFDSYIMNNQPSQLSLNRIDPFPNKLHPYEDTPATPQQIYDKKPEFDMRINNHNKPLIGSFASTFLPTKKREQIPDIEDQIRQFKSNNGNYVAALGNQEIQQQPVIQSPPKPAQQKVGPQFSFGHGFPLNISRLYQPTTQVQQEQPPVSSHSDRRVNLIPSQQQTQQSQMVLANQAKLQQLDRKGGQQQSLINKDVALPQLPPIDLAKYSGSQTPIIERFLDVTLLEKDVLESKQARHHLGLGMPEARAINKRNQTTTFRELINWYSVYSQTQGEKEAQMELQRAICSSQITAKIVALIILTGRDLGYNV